MITPDAIMKLAGYEEVKDLIPDGHLLRFTDIWRLSLEFYHDESDDLRRRMVLELGCDIHDRDLDRVAMVMESPAQISFPDSWQIMGLAIEDIRDRGLEGLLWSVYDFETSGFELFCASIRFERRLNTELSAAPNSRPHSELPLSSGAQSPDSQRTSSPRGCG